MAGKGMTAVDLAIAAGDSDRLRKLAGSSSVPEVRMLRLLVADLVERQAGLLQKNSRLENHHEALGAA